MFACKQGRIYCTAVSPLPHYIALPPLLHYNVSVRPNHQFECKNSSRAHILSHQQVPKTFNTFKIFKTRKFHKIQTLRNFTCPPSFDFAYSSVRPHAKKKQFFHSSSLNFCHHVCSLLGIHYLLRAHFSHRSRAHCWFHRRKNRTPFSGPEAVSCFLFLSRLNPFWVFGKYVRLFAHFLMIFENIVSFRFVFSKTNL